MDFWRGRLSLRRLAVLAMHLPVGSAVWAATADVPYGWTLTDSLLADVYHALTGEPHPLRPDHSAKAKAKKADDRIARLVAQRKRQAARQAAAEAPPPSE